MLSRMPKPMPLVSSVLGCVFCPLFFLHFTIFFRSAGGGVGHRSPRGDGLAVPSRRGGGPARGLGGGRTRRLPCGGAACAYASGSAPRPPRHHLFGGEAGD